MNRPTLAPADFNLRLFIDTNVLIDHIEEFDENKAQTFVNLFGTGDFKNVELVTSDYVLWELYGHLREELYLRDMILKKNYSCKRAHKGSRDFEKVSLRDMERFGVEVKKKVQSLERVITIEKLANVKSYGFADVVEKLLQSSKFSYKDAIIFVSALYTRSHIIITADEAFSKEDHLKKLKQAMEDLPNEEFKHVLFKKPKNLTTEMQVRKLYKNWFENCLKDKKLAKVINHWPNKNTLGVRCFHNYILKEGDYLCLVKFFGNILTSFNFRVEQDNLWDYDEEQPVKEGKTVTIKLPDSFSYRDKNWRNGVLFLFE